jgi:UDP-N-acetyl-2-amino-2-deoxyglucuronate dehydrogenase
VRVEPQQQKHEVVLSYITARGKWYYSSWKGDQAKSGGIATNIGIHFFDLLTWLFGKVVENTVHIHTHDRASGYLELDKARVKWFLSINEHTLPEAIRQKGGRTYRSITVDGEEIEFSEGFTDLHTHSYQAILDGKGFSLSDAATAVNIVHDIRNARPVGLHGTWHELASLPLAAHPFG